MKHAKNGLNTSKQASKQASKQTTKLREQTRLSKQTANQAGAESKTKQHKQCNVSNIKTITNTPTTNNQQATTNPTKPNHCLEETALTAAAIIQSRHPARNSSHSECEIYMSTLDVFIASSTFCLNTMHATCVHTSYPQRVSPFSTGGHWLHPGLAPRRAARLLRSGLVFFWGGGASRGQRHQSGAAHPREVGFSVEPGPCQKLPPRRLDGPQRRALLTNVPCGCLM